MAKTQPSRQPPIVVVFGDEQHQKSVAMSRTLAALLPVEADRAMALVTLDGTLSEDQGGPSFGRVVDELMTLPLLADRRVVVVRDADRFISAARERLEKYLTAPAATGTLLLECRSFPKTTRLYKAAAACGGQVHECKKLTGRALAGFVVDEAKARGKRIDPATAGRLCDLVGQDQGVLAAEVEKLCLYADTRTTISTEDVAALVGQSREEKIFRVLDAAGLGRLPEALNLWHQVLSTDPAAAFKSVGGIAFVLRRWLDAQQQRAAGVPTSALAPRLMMWGRERELDTLLNRLPANRLRLLLAELADLEAQAKSGLRSIERGVEALMVSVAAPAT